MYGGSPSTFDWVFNTSNFNGPHAVAETGGYTYKVTLIDATPAQQMATGLKVAASVFQATDANSIGSYSYFISNSIWNCSVGNYNTMSGAQTSATPCVACPAGAYCSGNPSLSFTTDGPKYISCPAGMVAYF